MNNNRSDFQNNNYGGTHRYRHPEQQDNYRFDDYGSAAHGGYGNESYSGTWGNQGDEGAGSGNVANHDLLGSTYSTSRNQGNMGGYGGAQGFGSSRGGYPTQRTYGSGASGHNFESGMGHPHEAGRSGYGSGQHRSYGYQSDSGNQGNDMSFNSNRDLYGSDNERRFQGSRAQQRYDFREDDYTGNSDRSMNYGQHMGNQVARGDYGSRDGNFGSLNGGSNGRFGNSSGQDYGMSGYYSGGYNDRDANYIQSRNRDRTFRNNKDKDNDYDRY